MRTTPRSKVKHETRLRAVDLPLAKWRHTLATESERLASGPDEYVAIVPMPGHQGPLDIEAHKGSFCRLTIYGPAGGRKEVRALDVTDVNNLISRLESAREVMTGG
jgi:hypothetical protein